eukprot:259261-Pelagomonas_calceolata.AAC.1
MCKLFQKDPAVHKLLKKPVSSCTTPLSEQAWRDHINNIFNHPSPSNEKEKLHLPSLAACSKDRSPTMIFMARIMKHQGAKIRTLSTCLGKLS